MGIIIGVSWPIHDYTFMTNHTVNSKRHFFAFSLPFRPIGGCSRRQRAKKVGNGEERGTQKSRDGSEKKKRWKNARNLLPELMTSWLLSYKVRASRSLHRYRSSVSYFSASALFHFDSRSWRFPCASRFARAPRTSLVSDSHLVRIRFRRKYANWNGTARTELAAVCNW